MKQKTFMLVSAILIATAVAAVLGASQIQSQTATPETRIYCVAVERGTSTWQMSDGYPVLSSYQFGSANFSTLPDVELGIAVTNNNTFTLFKVEVQVNYITTAKQTSSSTSASLGVLDPQETEELYVTLFSPELMLWKTKRPNYSNDSWENVTVSVLNTTVLNITAYGYRTP